MTKRPRKQRGHALLETIISAPEDLPPFPEYLRG
jgi:hypothetical protein